MAAESTGDKMELELEMTGKRGEIVFPATLTPHALLICIYGHIIYIKRLID